MSIKINPRNFLKRLSESIQQTLRPPPKLKLSEWADTYRVLSSEAAAEPGKWYTSRAEYQREILDTISDPTTERIVLMMGAQLGKSEALLNILGYFIHNDPAPILLVQHSVDEARKFSTTRIAPLLRETPVLRKLSADAKSRSSTNTITSKSFIGGTLTLVGANAPAGLASKPIRVLLMDEVDRYPLSAGTEGSPVGLAIKRTTTFFNRKIVLCSTPLIKDTSEIYAQYLQTDQRVYFIQCVHCGHYFEPKFFDHVRWSKDEKGHFIDGTTLLHCPECGVGHTDAERNHAVRKGRWVKTNPGAKYAGFNTSQLVSPFVKLDALVRDEWIPAIGDPQKLKVFFNTVLSVPYEEQSEGIDDIPFLDRLEEYELTELPNGITLLTAGVDVQEDRLEMSVWGWGKSFETWHVEHLVVHGNPSQTKTWLDLKQALLTKYRRADGTQLPIAAACIDSGQFTKFVYAFANSNNQHRWWAIKGASSEDTSAPIWPHRASAKVDAVKLYHVGTGTAKDTLSALLRTTTPGPGYVHFSTRCDADFFQQLTAERKVLSVDKQGKRKQLWKCPPGKRNEVWDCFVYALAARDSTGTRRIKPLEIVATARKTVTTSTDIEEQASTAPAPVKRATGAVAQPQMPALNTPAPSPLASNGWKEQALRQREQAMRRQTGLRRF